MTWIDTHCHLYASEFDADRDQVVRKALDAGVKQIMLPNIDEGSVDGMMELSDQFPDNCYPMMGLHPCSVKEDWQSHWQRIQHAIDINKCVGVGETGTDLYWDKSYNDAQIECFRQHLELGKETDLPVIIHSRDSLEQNIRIVGEHQDGRLRGIFHCFGGTLEQVMQIHALGFHIGIGGVVTFKNTSLRELLPEVPHEMIVLETDAPYLAPVPHRGKRNEPSFIPLIAEPVAAALGISTDELARLTSSNAARIFRKKA